MKTDDLKFGDIICVKSFNFIGWAIGKSFHVKSPMKWYVGTKQQMERPSNHNGIISKDKNGNICVYEALASGITTTSIEEYYEDVRKKRCEIKILRAKFPFTLEMIAIGQLWLDKQVGKKYDYISFISHIWRNTLNFPGIKMIQSENRFYCTEFVMKFYQFIKPFSPDNIETDFFKKSLPTPYTVEKRWETGHLKIIDEIF